MVAARRSNLLTVLVLLVVLVAALLAVNLAASAYILRIAIGLGISIILVVSLNLLNGFTGVFSLGQIGFMAIGAYAASILTLPISLKQVNLPDLPSWLAGVQASFLVATLRSNPGDAHCLPCRPIPHAVDRTAAAVATLGFLVIVR
jgi:branched-chain amino acid transport system permease protein